MKQERKKLINIFLLACVLGVLFTLNDSVFASGVGSLLTATSNEQLVGSKKLIPPSRRWWSLVEVQNLGEVYYYSLGTTEGTYRGYLQLNWHKSFGGNYVYEGYLYPEGKPYPVPAKIELLK
ncbi:hypothetical protein JDW15_09680 [Aerococcaceae bacterium zg-ZJ1578]|uniref:hypothetical protein n=1 Tax=Aerococcaceae bacterium zg-252 TaxID=2796928 RepID=UPI001A2EFF4A|nr:hypothetical protein [Aerococcaceae bacterium zg-1578]